MNTPTHLRIFTFGVFSNNHTVYCSWLFIAKRRSDSIKQESRPHIGKLLKGLANRQEEPTQSHIIRHPRVTHRPQIDSVCVLQLSKRRLGHHRAMFQIIFAAPRVALKLQAKAVHGSGTLEHADSFINYFYSDAISWNCRNIVSFHLEPLSGCINWRSNET